MSLALGLIVAVVIVLIVLSRIRRSRGNAAHSGSTYAAPGGAIPKIKGSGKFQVDVVGESFYAASFAELARRHPPVDEDSESFGDAVLTLDDDNPHDPKAVSVSIEGLQVGNLDRQMARDFRDAIARDGLAKYKRFAVSAQLYWGGEEGLRSVRIDRLCGITC